jgi:hypothetical protein
MMRRLNEYGLQKTHKGQLWKTKLLKTCSVASAMMKKSLKRLWMVKAVTISFFPISEAGFCHEYFVFLSENHF